MLVKCYGKILLLQFEREENFQSLRDMKYRIEIFCACLLQYFHNMNVSVALSVFECVKCTGKEEAAQTKQNHYFVDPQQVDGGHLGKLAAWPAD